MTDSTEDGNKAIVALRGLSLELSPAPPSELHVTKSAIQSTFTVKQLHDLLNGFVENPIIGHVQCIESTDEEKTILDCIDECLTCIDKSWNDKIITNKTAKDVHNLLCKKSELAINALISYYNDDLIIYDELLAMAIKTKEMNFVIKKQQMIYIPENWQEEKVEQIRNKLTHTSDYKSDNNDYKQPDYPAHSSHASRVVAMSIAEDVYSYVLRDKEMKMQNELSKAATILSDTTKFDENPFSSVKHIGTMLGTNIALNEEKEQHIEMIQTKGNKTTGPQDEIVTCAGCRQEFNMNKGQYKDTAIFVRADIMKKDEWFCFHDQYCVILRRLKESIRRYVLNETLRRNEKDDVRTVYNYVTDLLENYDLLITVEKHRALPKPFENENNDEINRKIIQLNRTHVHHSRMRWDKSKKKRNKSSDFPKSIKFCNTMIYGKSLATFIIYQLSAKQSDALWLVLAFILQQMPTTTAIKILEKYKVTLLKVQDVDNLDRVLSSVVQSSTYTVATALYLSAYIKEAGNRDVSRSTHWIELSQKYVGIALKLANSIESDHLLSLLMEIPTDLGGQSIFGICMKYGIIDFMDNARAQRLLTHLWSEFDFLNPHKDFRAEKIGIVELLYRLVNKPAEFYYCPVGGYWVESIMYMVYVSIVTGVVMAGEHDLTKLPTPLEWSMWFCSVGYLAAEISQITFYGNGYIQQVGNIMDLWIIANWIVIGIVRFNCVGITVIDQHCIGRDDRAVLIHMFFFCIQVVILWSRVALIFKTSQTVGPFIAMLPGMMRDICVWAFVLSIFFLGFGYGANFIVAGDISELPDYIYVFEYVFITLMGQSDWTYLNANADFSIHRSILLKVVMWAFAVMGTILLVNLLIAMMASTYEHLRDDRTKMVNFARSSQIYTSAYRYAIIPPPLNIIVYIVAVFWAIFEVGILLCSCRKLAVNLRKFDPVSVDFHTLSGQKNYNACPSNIESQEKCCRICLNISPHRSTRNWKSKDNYKRSAKYCRFCRCYMRETVPGSLPYYFSLFRNYRLDARDKKYLIALVQPNGVCPECFRPYLKWNNQYENESTYATDRLYRRIVVLEMISYWVFMAIMYLPLIILMSLPALFVKIFNHFSAIRYVQIFENKKTILIRDDKFTRSAENIIVDESTELQQIYTIVNELKTKIENNNNNNYNINKIENNNKLNKMITQKKIIINDNKSIIIDDDDLNVALELLEEVSTINYNDENKDNNNIIDDTQIELFESQLEELMINKHIRDNKRENMQLLKKGYENEENKIKLKIQIMLKNKNNNNKDKIIEKLQEKLNVLKIKTDKLKQKMDKKERSFKFEDTQFDESVNDITNKLEKLKNNNKIDKNDKNKQKRNSEIIEEELIDNILKTTVLDDDDSVDENT